MKYGNETKEASKLAFEIGVLQLTSQREVLINLRNQASISAAISGLILTVFASLLSDGRKNEIINASFVLGVSLEILLVGIFFGLSLYFAIQVVCGWKNCVFEFSPNWVEKCEQDDFPISGIYYKMANDSEDYFKDNEKVISRARSDLFLSLIFSWVQIPLWILFII